MIESSLTVLKKVTASILFAAAASPALAAWQNPTNGWDYDWTAAPGHTPSDANAAMVSNYNPGDPPATDIAFLTTDPTTNEDVLSLVQSAAGTKLIAMTSDVGAGGANNGASDLVTVDFRVRFLNDGQANAQERFAVTVIRDGKAYLARMSKVRIKDFSGGALQISNPPLFGEDFHDIRMTIDVAQDVFKVYLDGSDTPAFTSSGLTTALANQIQFGDGSGGINGSVNVSHLRFTNSELADVVPEPASLSLLFAGAVTMFVRQRRHR